jgi:hypothetical protein
MAQKISLMLFICFACLTSFAQPYVQKGLIRATSTLSPSLGIAYGPNNVYLSGELEGFLNSKHSLRGDVFALVGTLEDTQIFKSNHHLMVGPQWHTGSNRFDAYIGFQSGISATQYHNFTQTESHRLGFAPCFSINSGITYYVYDYFHFFANVRYLSTKYSATSFDPRHLDELIFSAGLGFHIKALGK